MGDKMAERMTFTEYLDSKKKLVTKPPVKKVPDYSSQVPVRPEKPAQRGKSWELMVKTKGEPEPYKAPGSDKDPGLQAAKDGSGKKVKGLKDGSKEGFGDMGDDKLKFKYDTDITTAGEGGKKVKTWPLTKTEEFLDKTKGMSLAEFTKHLRENNLLEHCGCEKKEIPHVVAYTSGPFHPDPIQAIKYVTFLSNENENIMRALIREAKRIGCLEKLVEELLDVPETYDQIAMKMDEGPAVAKNLVRAMRHQYANYLNELRAVEQVGPPMGMGDDDEEEDEDSPPSDKESDEAEEDEEGAVPGGITPGQGPAEHPEVGEDPMDMPHPHAKKQLAHDHLMNAMKDHPAMMRMMRSI
jgi:hypothetical protein